MSLPCPALHRRSSVAPVSGSTFPAGRAARAFTLIELLVVIAIIALLAALLFPAIAGALRQGRQTTSLNNLRQWAVAFASSVADNSGEMPSDGAPSYKTDDVAAWYNRLPPKIATTPLKDAGTDLPALGKKSVWINPGAPSSGSSAGGIPFCYGMNDYLSTTNEPNLRVSRVTYQSKTVLMAEKLPDSATTVGPENITGYFGAKEKTDPDAIANVLFVDGHVEGIKRSVYGDPSMASATTEEQMRMLPFLWQPYEGAEK